MEQPKTEWVSTDYYNLSDHNRICTNLNNPLILGNSLPMEITPHVVGDILTLPEKELIRLHYNKLVDYLGYLQLKKITRTTPHWFDWTELNMLEGMAEIAFDHTSKMQKYGNNQYFGIGTLGGGCFG